MPEALIYPASSTETSNSRIALLKKADHLCFDSASRNPIVAMNTDSSKLLPESIQIKVDAIERAIACAITVRRGSTAHHQANNSTPPTAICVCDDRGGRMRVNIILSVRAASHNLIHEILHAHRVVVLGVPRLFSPENPGSNLAIALENDAEHLFIVPEEIALVREAEAFWEKEYGEHLDELTKRLSACDSDVGQLPATKNGFLRLWLLVTRTLPRWQRRSELQELLQHRGWKNEADHFVDDVNRSGLDKAQVLAAFLRSGRLQIERFRLRSWNVQFAKTVETLIPSD